MTILIILLMVMHDFFIMKRDGGNLKNILAILLYKTIVGVVGEPKSVKKTQSGDVLIEVANPKQAENIVKIKSVGAIKVIVIPHCTFNTSKGVISETDLLYDSESEIFDSLFPHSVINVKRITLRRDGKIMPAKHLILTF